MKINKKALLLGTMAFVLVAASGMVSAYASGSSGTKKAKVQTIRKKQKKQLMPMLTA